MLEYISREKFLAENFYLTGGTALAGFYTHHRYSEDLDFFSEKEVDPAGITIFLRTIQPISGHTTVDYQQSFNRHLFFLHFGNEILKTEFTYFPFTRIESGTTFEGIEIDSIRDIAVNKLFTIYQRSKARDYIDLYVICCGNNWSIQELISQAKVKFDWHIDPLQLGTQFIKAKDAKDYPRMISSLPPTEWQTFFEEEAKKIKPDILSK